MTSPVFQWPIAATPFAWSVGGFWLPGQAAGAQGSSTLFSVLDGALAEVATLTYDATASTLVGTVGPATIETDALAFTGSEALFIALRFDDVDGLALTVNTAAGGVQHVTDPSIDPGTTAAVLGTFEVGEINGVIDEVMIFAGRLTNTQGEALADAGVQLASLPADPRLVWYAAFDADLEPTPGALATGRRVETTEDPYGFKRVVASLTAVDETDGFGIDSSTSVMVIELAAALATTGTEDAAADLHDQFAAASEQKLRVRE